jgi:small subunit ribosomal protein S8
MAVLSDPISDFITRLKNASNAGNESFTAPFSKMKAEIARILTEEGYIWNYETKTDGEFPVILVKVKYSDAGEAVLHNVKRVSKPGLRQYVSAGAMPRVLSGLGVAIISTSKGLMTGQKARKAKLGGEHLANVW